MVGNQGDEVPSGYRFAVTYTLQGIAVTNTETGRRSTLRVSLRCDLYPSGYHDDKRKDKEITPLSIPISTNFPRLRNKLTVQFVLKMMYDVFMI